MINRTRAQALTGGSLLVAGWMMVAAPTWAQADDPATKPATSVDAGAGVSQEAVSGNAAPDVSDIIVTGSRVAANGNAQPTPVTVVSSDRLAAAAPKGVAEALLQVPSFSGSNSRAAGGAAANAGHTYLNLRGLGTQRNLVLLDGRRFVSTSDGGAPDINLFPQLLLQRVEVVTGGASAAYGSDAVAGVTNFILDDHYQGVKGLVSRGESRYGDDRTWRAQSQRARASPTTGATLSAASTSLTATGHMVSRSEGLCGAGNPLVASSSPIPA